MEVVDMVEKRKEVCRLLLEEGKEIKIERERYEVIYDTSFDEITLKLVYCINGTAWFDSIEKELSILLDMTITGLSDTFNADSEERLYYKINLPLNELDELSDILKEHDDKVINTLKGIIEEVRKIKEAIVNHF